MTYAIRNDVMVTVATIANYEERSARLAEVQKGQPGFRSTLLFKSLSNPTRYVRSTIWDSRQASDTSMRSEETRGFLAASPATGISTPNRPLEGYELVVAVGDPLPASELGYLTQVEWNLDTRPGNAAAFEQSRKEFFELRQKHLKEFVRAGLWRLAGSSTRYLVSWTHRGPDDLRTAAPVPEIQEWAKTHGASVYMSTPGAGPEVYEVVQRVVK